MILEVHDRLNGACLVSLAGDLELGNDSSRDQALLRLGPSPQGSVKEFMLSKMLMPLETDSDDPTSFIYDDHAYYFEQPGRFVARVFVVTRCGQMRLIYASSLDEPGEYVASDDEEDEETQRQVYRWQLPPGEVVGAREAGVPLLTASLVLPAVYEGGSLYSW